MASYHKSNWGKSGDRLVTDIDGYTYTTPEEWRDVANVSVGDLDEACIREWSEEQARAAQAAIDDANADVSSWRSGE